MSDPTSIPMFWDAKQAAAELQARAAKITPAPIENEARAGRLGHFVIGKRAARHVSEENVPNCPSELQSGPLPARRDDPADESPRMPRPGAERPSLG